MKPTIGRAALVIGGIALGTISTLLWFNFARSGSPSDIAKGQIPASSIGTNQSPGFSSPLLEPTAPIELKRVIAPWEPHRALVVGLTSSVVKSQPDTYDTILQLIRIASEIVDVVVMIPDRWPEAEVRTLRHFADEPEVRKRLHFVPSSIASIWTRDYLPQYGLARTGRLALIDSRTVDFFTDPVEMVALMSDLSSDKNHGNAKSRIGDVMGDDIAPSFLGSFLRTHYKDEVRLVRPPVMLDGGDFVLLTPKEVVLSESTLRYNGGQDEELRAIIRQYYGLNKVHFLPTLPGRTIDHLDFIMQAFENAIIAASPPKMPPSTQLYAKELGKRIENITTGNLAYLRANFPNKRLIEVPMPPPVTTSRDEILEKMRFDILVEAAKANRIDFRPWLKDGSSTTEGAQTLKAIYTVLQNRFGPVDIDRNESDLNRVSKGILELSIAEYEQNYIEDFVTYRTYVNSTFIRAEDGRSKIIVPRYKPRNKEEANTFPAMELKVQLAYKEALPEAEFVWLDCDAIIEEFGAVHCISHTIPILKK